MSKIKVWGHRGCSTEYPENTLLAFKAAAEVPGIAGIETDVQMSKDGILMIMHDEKLDRTTNGNGYLCEKTLEELKKLEVARFEGEICRIPTLEEMFVLLKPYCIKNGLLINLELKNSILRYEGMEQKVLGLVKKFEMEEYIIYSSFLPESMGLIRKLNPDAQTGILGEDEHFCLEQMDVQNAQAIHPWVDKLDESKEFVDKLQGIPVRVWNMAEDFYHTKKECKEYNLETLEKYGVTDFITNVPDKYIGDKRMNVCRICGEKVELLETVTESKYDVVEWKTFPFNSKKKDLPIYVCNKCSLVQAPYLYEDDFYSLEYSENEGFAQYYSLNNHVERSLQKLSNYVLKSEIKGEYNYLEVGCGIGAALDIAKKYFTDVIGIEPSYTGNVARKKGHKIISKYMDDSVGIVDEYAAMATFMVLEHMEKPVEALRSMWKALKPNGVVLINIPNGTTIIKEQLYHQVICEHLNYFTAESLFELAKITGFKVLEIENDIENIEYNVFLQKIELNKTSFLRKKQEDKKTLHSLLETYKHIGIWGAGAKAVTYSELLSSDQLIEHLFDGDVNKSGKYISGISVPIEVPTKDVLALCDVVVIFATTYTAEIINRMRNELCYSGDIIQLDGDVIRKA